VLTKEEVVAAFTPGRVRIDAVMPRGPSTHRCAGARRRSPWFQLRHLLPVASIVVFLLLGAPFLL